MVNLILTVRVTYVDLVSRTELGFAMKDWDPLQQEWSTSDLTHLETGIVVGHFGAMGG